MPLALIAVLMLAGTADGPDPRDLIARLSSESSAERFAAIDAIEAIGPAMLNPLRERLMTGDERGRRVAADLIDRIGTRRLLRAKKVKLDIEDLAPKAAVEALSRAAGYLVELDPSYTSKAGGGKITFKGDSLSFFEAVDRLGEVAGFRHEPSPSYRPQPPGVVVRLVGTRLKTAPSCYLGPYRVTLLSLNRHRTVVQANDPSASRPSEEFSASISVTAEPGILIARNESPHLDTAIDDRGRDLRPAPIEPAPPRPPMPYASTKADFRPGAYIDPFRHWGQEAIGSFTITVPLHLPEDRGKAIAKLAGDIPITAVVRTEEILSATIAEARAQPISAGGLSLKIARSDPKVGVNEMEIHIKGLTAREPAFAAGPRQTTEAILRLGYNLDDHLRVEDAEGRAYATNAQINPVPLPDGTLVFRVTFFPIRGGMTAPVRFRYFGVAAVATELPFEFKDLAIP